MREFSRKENGYFIHAAPFLIYENRARIITTMMIPLFRDVTNERWVSAAHNILGAFKRRGRRQG